MVDCFLVVTGTTKGINCLQTLEIFPPHHMDSFILTWSPFSAIFTLSYLWRHSILVCFRLNGFFNIVSEENWNFNNLGFPHWPADYKLTSTLAASEIWQHILPCPISRWLRKDLSYDMVCFVIPGALFCHSSVSSNQWWRSHVLFFLSPCIFAFLSLLLFFCPLELPAIWELTENFPLYFRAIFLREMVLFFSPS